MSEIVLEQSRPWTAWQRRRSHEHLQACAKHYRSAVHSQRILKSFLCLLDAHKKILRALTQPYLFLVCDGRTGLNGGGGGAARRGAARSLPRTSIRAGPVKIASRLAHTAGTVPTLTQYTHGTCTCMTNNL
ncbi:hypothetical protein EVAR_74634_1 [Eumeta japonica]|uniref:Uncharacterized protein n=1 Tax=Eumeta variegata TaxID=151549 RepID=A0A4C1WCC5_EUMVA|nr:hypothetical protein EVAR_74634_1 [Eumeta japonica]